MHICIFSRPFHPAVGGLERMAMTLAVEFSSAGHNVEVVTDTPHPQAHLEHHPFTITRTTSNWERFQAFRRSDITLLMNVSLYAVPLTKLARVPTYISHQGIYGARQFGLKVYLRERLKHHLTRWFFNIACSQFVASKLPAEAVVIPNAYDDALFNTSVNCKKERDFVFCGRLVSDKGADVALKAFAGILVRYPQATCTIVGDGPELKNLQSLSVTLGCDHATVFTGFLRGTSLREELQKHRCMLVPSLWEEPFGIVALEGIACCGRVVVARRGGLPEAVGECGVAVEPTADAFRIAMLREMDRFSSAPEVSDVTEDEHRRTHLEAHQAKAIAARYLQVLIKPPAPL